MKTFCVVWLAGFWIITSQGEAPPRFSYRVDAEEAALRLAAKAITNGYSVKILVQGPGGEMSELTVPQPDAQSAPPSA